MVSHTHTHTWALTLIQINDRIKYVLYAHFLHRYKNQIFFQYLQYDVYMRQKGARDRQTNRKRESERENE